MAGLETAYARLRRVLYERDDGILPTHATLEASVASLPQDDDPTYLVGRGSQATLDHLFRDIVPALNGQNLTGRYYGFVTGSSLPIAEVADNIVSALDQNVQVHLPDQTVSTIVEDTALRMLAALLELNGHDDNPAVPAGHHSYETRFPSRTFTTGATASNILGLACGREAVITGRIRRQGPEEPQETGSSTTAVTTVAGAGLLAACLAAGVRRIQVLTSMCHSSLSKAASIIGLGRGAVRDLPASASEPWRLNLDAVEHELSRGANEGVVSIIVVGAGEVNTGRFGTNGLDMPKLRSLADRYGAWIHVDGAFGIFARALPQRDEFLTLRAQTAGLELADSIALDCHKLLNVPYDTGAFFCRSPVIQSEVFSNANASYLSSHSSSQIPSPLNIGLENSRRFRALPVYAVLLSEGRSGLGEMFARMVRLAREVAAFVRDSDDYEWLPDPDASLDSTHIVVLFRARDSQLNENLAQRINETRRMYVSETRWDGQKACRIAVSSYRVDVKADLAVVKDVLRLVVQTKH
ncbi:hypothetical protein VTK73DRAFT_3741 [Phialemonium thermophilum]|uniref:L-2,4-diaminobutyrate decarboxylase n=1 Tax=Phialemonium thermophilum TaxID=223376 RepID=A0ABR3Y0P2_9PEZI